jgi:Putative bacterial sensory transduction regulator
MPLTFTSSAHEECYQLVEDYLIVLGLDYVKHDDVTVFSLFPGEGLHVRVGVTSWGDNDALVMFVAPLVRNARQSAALLRYMLEQNFNLPLGHFAMDDDGDIYICHNCGGNELDRGELIDALTGVAALGAREAEALIQRFGGERI